MTQDRIDEILGKTHATRRGMLKAMIVGSAFVAPMIASFSMDGRLTTSEALAQASNATVGGDSGGAPVPRPLPPPAGSDDVSGDDVAGDDVAVDDDVGGDDVGGDDAGGGGYDDDSKY